MLYARVRYGWWVVKNSKILDMLCVRGRSVGRGGRTVTRPVPFSGQVSEVRCVVEEMPDILWSRSTIRTHCTVQYILVGV